MRPPDRHAAGHVRLRILLAGFTYGAMRSPRFHGQRMTLMLTVMAVVTVGFRWLRTSPFSRRSRSSPGCLSPRC